VRGLDQHEAKATAHRTACSALMEKSDCLIRLFVTMG
jgi:hypothetical protein